MPPIPPQRPPFAIRRGLIVWWDDCPPLDDDKEKRRPIIVVEPVVPSPTPGDAVANVVACSATYGQDEPDGILMPNRTTEPHTTTGLPNICWAIPRWWLPIGHADLHRCEYSGTLGGRKLQLTIAAYLARRAAVRPPP